MKVRIKETAKHKILSNKARYAKGDRDNSIIAYHHDDYYITIPFIDKIVICGTPPNVPDKELVTFIKYLVGEVELKKDDENYDTPLSYLKLPKKDQNYWRRFYTDIFKVAVTGGEEFISLFLGYRRKNEGQRFIRMEFNPWRLQPNNVRYFIDWYNQVMDQTIGTRFADIISKGGCINRIDIAIDIVGIHISDLIFNLDKKGKSCRWFSAEGELETYYFDAKPGKNCKVKAYNKAEQMQNSPYGVNIPVTRIEATVTNPSLALTELSNLQNKMKNVKIYRLDNLHEFVQKHVHDNYDLDLFLDSVRHRGVKAAVKKLPEHLQAKYAGIMKHATVNLFEGYNDRKQWARLWLRSVRYSGLLHGLS